MHLVALVQWWSKEGSGCDNWWFEQEAIEIPLQEWVLLIKVERKKFQRGQNMVQTYWLRHGMRSEEQ